MGIRDVGFLVLVAVYFLICHPSYAQTKDFYFIKGKHRYEIPFEYKNDFIVVTVYFNEVFPLSFIFDTGAEHTILVKREIADLFQIDYTRKFTLYGADLSEPLYAYLAPGITLQVANIRAINRSILVLDEDYINFKEVTGIDIHGILGADFFRRFVVQIDYRKQKIILHDPKYFKSPQKKYEEVPVDIKRNKPYINSDIFLNQEDDVNVNLLLDTGASLALMLYTTTNDNLKLPEKVLNTEIGMGLGGFIEGYIGRIYSFELKDYLLYDVITNYQDLATIADSTTISDRNGLVGNLLLRRFDLIIDYVNSKLYLNPNKFYKEKFKYDKSGIVLAAGGKDLTNISILKVIKDTPADQAGLQQGDRILRINGLPTFLLSLESIIKKLKRKEGKKIKLLIKRNNVKKKFIFNLKNLI